MGAKKCLVFAPARRGPCGAGQSLWESQGTSLTWVSTSALAANKLGGLGQPPHHLSLHGFASEMGILTSNPQGQCMDSKG